MDLEARNRHLKTPLHFAMEYGILEMVELFIQRGANVNCKSEHDRTPLHALLIYLNDAAIPIAKKLLQSGADVNAITDTGVTALMLAGTAKMTSFLLEHHARVDAVNSYGNTALHLAVGDGNYDRTRTLLDAGANVSLRDDMGRTALYDAVMGRDVYIVELLIMYGSDSSTLCLYGHSPASMAALQNNQPMVDAIKTAEYNRGGREAIAMGLYHRAGELSDLSTLREDQIVEDIMRLAFPTLRERERENNQHER